MATVAERLQHRRERPADLVEHPHHDDDPAAGHEQMQNRVKRSSALTRPGNELQREEPVTAVAQWTLLATVERTACTATQR